MPNPSRAGTNRPRRSCEPCRRKKVRCGGEMPVCSFCNRLRQECTYKNRRGTSIASTASPVQESPTVDNSTDRLQLLESKIDNLYGLIETRTSEKLAGSEPDQDDIEFLEGQNSSQVQSIVTESGHFGRAPVQPLSNFHDDKGEDNPQSDDIENALQVYADRVHGQPLMLFEPFNLAHRARSWPSFLRNILKVMAARWSIDSTQRVASLDRSALLTEVRREIMSRATVPEVDVNVLQALCLLILEEIADSNKTAAWMSIAIAARLSCISKIIPRRAEDRDWIMATWSLHILDLVYCSSLSMVRALPKDLSPPAIPRKKRRSPTTDQGSSYKDFQSVPEQGDRSCINNCYAAILSVWSDAIELLSISEKNKLPPPWADESPYRKIAAKLYDFETNLLQAHRVRHVRPDLRVAADIEKNRSYWSTWFSVQILFHAVQAMVNHPVLHIAGISRSQQRRPPSFLQHTVDELFQHSGWVKKLIDLGAEKDFTFNDPFIAYVAGICATGYMFFINSDDAPLARQAELGFDACYAFVDDYAARWPHVENTVQKLGLLRASVNDGPSAHAPSIQASLLWSLFDYSSSSTPSQAYEKGPTSRLKLGVATQYLSSSDSVQTPRIDELGRAQHPHPAEDYTETYDTPGQAVNFLDNDLSLFDSTLFAGFQPSNFGDEFFADFGQL